MRCSRLELEVLREVGRVSRCGGRQSGRVSQDAQDRLGSGTRNALAQLNTPTVSATKLYHELIQVVNQTPRRAHGRRINV